MKFYLSFDLGLQSDYQGLYSWLDKFQALQCGSRSLAYFDFPINLKSPSPIEIFNAVQEDLFKSFTPIQGDSLYLVFPDADGSTKGVYLYGNRKTAPWNGFYTQ